jgi:hypothetical protein
MSAIPMSDSDGVFGDGFEAPSAATLSVPGAAAALLGHE